MMKLHKINPLARKTLWSDGRKIGIGPGDKMYLRMGGAAVSKAPVEHLQELMVPLAIRKRNSDEDHPQRMEFYYEGELFTSLSGGAVFVRIPEKRRKSRLPDRTRIQGAGGPSWGQPVDIAERSGGRCLLLDSSVCFGHTVDRRRFSYSGAAKY